MIGNFWIRNTRNAGDLHCGPALYFSELNARAFDIAELPPGIPDLAIFGGGALGRRFMNNPGLLRRAKVNVAWGVGTSLHGKNDVPPAPPGFGLYGSRDDRQQGARWVPCASCMSPLFDAKYDALHDTVVYYNKDPRFAPPDIEGLPVMHNEHGFEDAVRFLGSAGRVITNSYHGAYWAALLGRKVVVAAPYSSKFMHFRHRPAYSPAKDSWKPALEVAGIANDEALAECREANRAFLGLVLDRLHA